MSFVYIPPEDLAKATPDQRRQYAEYCVRKALETNDWHHWLHALFPRHIGAGFAAHHEQFWDWLWAITPEAKPDPFVAVWPRGGAKSTSAELGVIVLAARRVRNYVLYVCGTQDQADDHVANIGGLLESSRVGLAFPELGERAVGKYGNSKGWRRNRLRTTSGFIIDALGLNTAARGLKIEEQRPDFIVLDDLDDTEDGPATTARKERAITRQLLPTGELGGNLGVLAIQNLVIPTGVFARLANVADPPADYLRNRIVSGPVPAIRGLVLDDELRIIAGEPSWDGQDLEVCQAEIDEYGPSAFRIEAQHEVDLFDGGMFSDVTFRHCLPDEVPELVQTEVWVDPAVTATDQSDSMGIQVDGTAPDGTIYRLWSWERRATPVEALSVAIRKAYEHGAVRVGVETDQGRMTWQSVYREALAVVLESYTGPRREPPWFDERQAGAGFGPKAARAQQMLTDYEHGRIVHVVNDQRTHETLERALRRFPLAKPYDLVDAAFWSWNALRVHGQGKTVGVESIISTHLPVATRGYSRVAG